MKIKNGKIRLTVSEQELWVIYKVFAHFPCTDDVGDALDILETDEERDIFDNIYQELKRRVS